MSFAEEEGKGATLFASTKGAWRTKKKGRSDEEERKRTGEEQKNIKSHWSKRRSGGWEKMGEEQKASEVELRRENPKAVALGVQPCCRVLDSEEKRVRERRDERDWTGKVRALAAQKKKAKKKG